MQAQPHIVPRGQDRVHPRGKVRQQPAELSEGVRRIQLVQVINNQCDAVASIGEFREHPAGHRRRVEVGRRGRRFRAAVCTGGLTDRVEQGQPELLGVLLVALHLQHGEPARLPRTAGPRTQQRRLPAASRRRDNRHLPRCRAVQGGEKIVASDQPGSADATFTRLRPALLIFYCR